MSGYARSCMSIFDKPALSIVIPARNAEASIGACLAAIHGGATEQVEITVVDDGSTDGTAGVARAKGALVLRRASTGGPAAARNEGARAASADIVLFVDADIVVASDAVARVLQAMREQPDVAAVFGSYDDSPSAGTLVSDYRNLLHHFVHQSARNDSSSFWAGLGAVRKRVFLAVGGFDERYRRPSIEDIELGSRLAKAGHRVRLDKALRGCHLKHSTFGSVLVTDVRDRAYPWARLVLRCGSVPADLNLQAAHRISAVLVWVGLIAAIAAVLVEPTDQGRWLAAIAAAAFAGLMWLNRGFYAFLSKRRGVWFAAPALLLHWTYYAYASATFVWASICHVADKARALSRKGQRGKLASDSLP